MKKFGKLLLTAVLILTLAACADKPEEHIHKYAESTVTKEATCTEDGLIILTCSCGASCEEVIPAEHPYDAGADVQSATCTQDGIITAYCHCGASKTAVFPAKGHSWTEDSWEHPTCTEEGSTTYKCTRDKCEETYTQVEPATGHSWEMSAKKDATCTEEGKVTYTCDYCEETDTESIPSTDHFWLAYWEDPTCTEEGKVTYTCDYCKESYTETKPALGHDWSQWEQTIEPNVAMDGLEERYCHRCYIDETRVLEKLAGDFTLYPTFVAHLDWQGLGYFDSPDDLAPEDVFRWATWRYLQQFEIESDEDYPGYPQTYRVEDLDAFTLSCLGRTYDYSQMQGDFDVEYIYNAEKGTITAVYGGAGGTIHCSPIYESHTQLDATHYAIYYYNDCGNDCDFALLHGQRGVILVEIRDGSYIIVSHTSA